MPRRHFWSVREAITPEDWTVIGDSGLILVMAGATVARADRRPDAFHIHAGRPGCGHFRLDRKACRLGGFGTHWAPYDKLVCAILAVAAAQTDSVHVTSEASLAHWHSTLEWAGQVLRRPVPVPTGVLYP